MELHIVIGDQTITNDLSIDYNSVILFTNSGKNIFNVINGTNERINFISELETYEEEENSKDLIKFVNNLSNNLDASSFDKHFVRFDENIDPTEFATYFESITGKLEIDVSNLTDDNIIKFKSIKFKTEPHFKTKYDTLGGASLKDLISSITIIEEMKDYILKFNLSPIEQLLLLYDLNKERMYKIESDEDIASSRDLSRILKGENIVCQGYANIFSAVSNALGIKSYVKKYLSSKSKNGHSTNINYISDDKYDIHAPLEFDLTWDTKKSTSDENYVDNYRWFGDPEYFANKKKEAFALTPTICATEYIESANDKYQVYIDTSPNEDMTESFMAQMSINNLLKRLERYFSLIGDIKGLALIEEYNNNQEDMVNADIRALIKELMEEKDITIQRGIDYNSLIAILYNVRRIEHYINPKKYPLDEANIRNIVKNKYGLDLFFKYSILNKGTIKEIINRGIKGSFPKGDKIPVDLKRMELMYDLNQIKEQQSHGKKI